MIFRSAFFLFLLIFCAFAAEEMLNKANFDSEIKAYKMVLVNFYADWCHFCKNLAPIYHEFADRLESKKLDKTALISKVDCVADPDLCQRFEVNKYPTLKLYREGQVQKKEYRGSRTVEALVEYMEKQMQNPWTVIEDTFPNFETIRTKYDHEHVLGVFSDLTDANSEFAMFKKVASSLSETCSFYVVAGFPDKQGTYFRIHDNWEEASKTPLLFGSQSLEEAVTTVKNKCRAKVRELLFENAEEITEEGLPLFVMFYKPDDVTARFVFKSHIAKHFENETTVTFLTANSDMFQHPLRHLGVQDHELPVVVIDSFQHMYRFKHNLDEAYKNPKMFRKFINDLHSGKLHTRLHFGGNEDDEEAPGDAAATTPPPSVFEKLKPNRNRYSMPHDEF